jgi:hypothetical protein
MLESQSRVQRRRHSEEEPRPKLDRLVSVGETGDILGVSDPTVRRLIKRGMLEAVHLRRTLPPNPRVIHQKALRPGCLSPKPANRTIRGHCTSHPSKVCKRLVLAFFASTQKRRDPVGRWCGLTAAKE